MAEQHSLFDFAPDEPSDVSADACEPVLFGWADRERVVAVEGAPGGLRVWTRHADDSLSAEDVPVRPWILTKPGVPVPSGATRNELKGDGFSVLTEYDSWDTHSRARRLLRDEHAAHVAYATPAKTALTRLGITLFRGMTMSAVRRMQVDIETAALSAESVDARILLIAVADNRGMAEILTGPEPEILERFVAMVRARDPDVVEGHNIHGFDLPYIAARCRRHGIPCALGRDGSEMRAGARRTFAVGGITRPVEPWLIYGRHVIDTFLAVQRFDWAKGSLTGYGLKEVARAFGIAETDRIELPREQMASIFRDDPQRVAEYARQDVAETARLAELVSATEFYQTQMVPDSYGSCALSGTGEKINSIFVRAYIRAGCAVPEPQPIQPYEGGYTELRRTGVIRRVVKADVESLYPSIMLTSRIEPRTDTLHVFLPALRELTRRRLEAKARARATQGSEAHYWDGLQSSFKVLINSFYGYLGAGAFNFNDPAAAGEVTRIGRDIVRSIAARIEESGGSVIEIDTDGVYFAAPADVEGEAAERAYVAAIGAELPEGIRLAFDGRYRAMVSLKTKNYVLCDYDGKRTFRGASVRSRADELYGRRFLAAAVDLLLDGRTDSIRALYLDVAREIREHRLPVADLARRERVTDKTFQSSARARMAEVAMGRSIGDYVYVYERANGRLGLVDEYVPGDENVAYYVDKLYKFACRLREAIGDTFVDLIPRPNAAGEVETDQLSLFD